MAQELNAGTILHGSYRIERVLGQGGFGITYLATDLSLDRKVAVKEFFPKDYCNREEDSSHITIGTHSAREFVERLRGKFLKEARNIAKFNHPGIIRIYSAFEENNTAYYVMEYIEGASLWEIVRCNGPLTEKKALDYIMKVGDALNYVHQRRINHLDVKPANIMVSGIDDIPVLIDFGLSKQYDNQGLQTSTTPTGISHGFAPIEQYNEGGVSEFSPQTDLYSLAATLYFILTGIVPPKAISLIESHLAFPDNFPSRFINSLSKAMSTSRMSRQTSVADFIAEISCNLTEISIPQPIPTSDTIIDSIETIKPKSKVETAQAVPTSGNKIFNVNGVSFKMIHVDGGTFRMGSNSGYPDEKPVHNVTLTDFMIGETVVTQALWKAVMGNNPSYNEGDNLPVENVSWNDCQEFIERLNSITGQRFHLPTEAQWEYAARGGSKSQGYIYSGSDNLDISAWYGCNSVNHTHVVNTKVPNEIGLYDMSGNVWEWCLDWHGNYQSSSLNNPTGPYSGLNRVKRGGSYNNPAAFCRVSSRSSMNPSEKSSCGFRLAL